MKGLRFESKLTDTPFFLKSPGEKAVLRIREFFTSLIRIKECKNGIYLTQKIVSKLSEI
jgi:hypothetical protein